MSTQLEAREVEQLRQLYTLREKRALESLAAQRIELKRVFDRLAEQEALIKSLRDELDALHQMRSRNAIKAMTATSLKAESDRRQMLTQDLEMEDFYLPGFERDVSEAQVELEQRQGAWTRIRERVKSLKKMDDKNHSKALRLQSRQEDAMLDDRRTQV